ncbi:winged helix-turn-helix transcriptional regulator [Streptomyces zhihengii]|uniref:Helix-turn-helix transcriptional regulator n=1 Tax=Streptomyces zhihengii TaxID=1818004 RepID=A0ABS2UJY2_9ACTN|nr:helix-turn-helix domain-containing protein [Streptomyces zhihengii]MBM9617848.1 helix-turn-helix transcriptional regulator [Streptomyces zhihengii]
MASTGRRGPYFCGIDAAMDVVSGKWKSLILWELQAHGRRRFAELRRGLPGVSEKMLAQHLREMEEDALVHREVYGEVPPRVEYSLTEHGVTLNAALESLAGWGSARIERIGAERLHAGADPDAGAESDAGAPGGGAAPRAGARSGGGAAADAPVR